MRHFARPAAPLLALLLLQFACNRAAHEPAGPSTNQAAQAASPAPTVSEQELQQVRQALEKDMADQPDNVHYNMGNVLMVAGKHQEAINEFKQALQLNPQDADSYVHMGDAYLALSQTAQGLDAYQQALQINPRHAEALVHLGDYSARAEQADE